MKKWYIKLLVRRGNELVHPCGTDYSMLYDDLKTLRGVINRMKKWSPFITDKVKPGVEVVGFEIYNYTNLYDEDTHRLVCESYLGDSLFREILSAQLHNNK